MFLTFFLSSLEMVALSDLVERKEREWEHEMILYAGKPQLRLARVLSSHLVRRQRIWGRE